MAKRNKQPKPNTSKICVNCAFAMLSSNASPFCSKSKGIDLVTGEEEFSRARTMRHNGECGVEGKFFIKKK